MHMTRSGFAFVVALVTMGGAPHRSGEWYVEHSSGGTEPAPTIRMRGDEIEAQDLRELLAAAKGVPPIVCALAADAVWGMGWRGGYDDAPSSPVSSHMRGRLRDIPGGKII